jgi:hypothetical protein
MAGTFPFTLLEMALHPQETSTQLAQAILPDRAIVSLNHRLKKYQLDANELIWAVEHQLLFRQVQTYNWAVVALAGDYRLASFIRYFFGVLGVCEFSYNEIAGRIRLAQERNDDTIRNVNLKEISPETRGWRFRPYVPHVGLLLIQEKSDLRLLSQKEFFFERLWEDLEKFPAEDHVLLLADPLPREWLSQQEHGDHALYLNITQNKKSLADSLLKLVDLLDRGRLIQ